MPKLLAIGQTAELKAKKTEVESGVKSIILFYLDQEIQVSSKNRLVRTGIHNRNA